MNVQTKNAHTLVRIERHPKKKAYMKLHTSFGDLNLELHCDMAPRTCENFLVLSESSYYQDTIFHRCIKNFMIQVSLDPDNQPPTLKVCCRSHVMYTEHS